MRLTAGFVQLVCRWSAGGDRAGRAHTHTHTDTRTRSVTVPGSGERRVKFLPELVIGCTKSLSNSLWSLMVLTEDFRMIEVSIPSMEREVDESGKSKKVRTVFVSVTSRRLNGNTL